MLLQNENKTLQDAEKENHGAWDGKFKQILWQLEGLQDGKDNPQAQVVQVEVDELLASPDHLGVLVSNSSPDSGNASSL